MGKRGPKPTPKATLKLRGSWLADRMDECPEPPVDRPDRPDWVADAARECWEYIVPYLEAMRVLSKADRNALARYCEYYALWLLARERVRVHGMTDPVYDKEGNPIGEQESAAFKAMLKLNDMLCRLEACFGLTPSARSRLTVSPAETKKPDGGRRIFTG